MGLVDYSDSEASDAEKTTAKQPPSKPSFQKVINPSEPRKIKVDLPAPRVEATSTEDDAPPAKKARTTGTFSGFNSMLPAPKRPAVQSAPKSGVSLKTSSEAAFSRAPPQGTHTERYGDDWEGGQVGATEEREEAKVEEPKIVGKATRFKPLSVANNKKKKPLVKNVAATVSNTNGDDMRQPPSQSGETVREKALMAPDPPPPKPKRSLFSVPQEEDRLKPSVKETYEPFTSENPPSAPDGGEASASQPFSASPNPKPSSLQSLTADLNLTPAQQRHLFGRQTKSGGISITHFNMESEYAANEQLRQAGEVVEHRAVKAIAPGKHSLQQLVNNARSQHEAMEDKWAEGRNARGEGGAKYGWGK